ncbi:isochorismatase family protein [Kitasatospora aburaviensis]
MPPEPHLTSTLQRGRPVRAGHRVGRRILRAVPGARPAPAAVTVPVPPRPAASAGTRSERTPHGRLRPGQGRAQPRPADSRQRRHALRGPPAADVLRRGQRRPRRDHQQHRRPRQGRPRLRRSRGAHHGGRRVVLRPLLPQLAEVFPKHEVLDRTSMNAWEDAAVVEAVKATGRTKIVLSGLWTEVCLVLPALSALGQGYEVYVVADASGGVSAAAHEHALQRMTAAGAVPVTWVQVLLELQRDWARQESYGAVMEIVKEHAGAYGLGVVYAQSILGAHAAG